MNSDKSLLRVELIGWAESIVRDRLHHHWSSAGLQADLAHAMAERQWRVWNNAFSGLFSLMNASRRDLMGMSANAGLSAALIEAGDEIVIDEIADVIISRFRRSPNLAKDYTKILVLTAAELLGQERFLEAA